MILTQLLGHAGEGPAGLGAREGQAAPTYYYGA